MTDVSVGEIVQLIKTEKMAVVTYIGPTNFKSGIWYGLHLDGPDGTHDGIVEGKRYFTCPANHGKMVQARAIQSVEQTIFRKPARVFSFNAEKSAWTEKGTGAFTLRQSTKEDKRARIYMKKDNNSSVYLVDHPINPKTQLEKSRGSNTAWVYKVRKHSVNADVDEVLAVQFGSAEVAMEFHRLHSTCCADMTKAPSPAKIAAAAAAPKVSQNRIVSLRELDHDKVYNLLPQKGGQQIDLSLLTANLSPQSQITEADELWDYDILIKSVKDELQKEKDMLDQHGAPVEAAS